MFVVDTNPQIPFSRALSGGFKGYDEIGRDALLRYLLGSTATGNKQSVGSNDTQPASAGKFATIRGVDFSGYIAAYPTYPNGNTTIQENWVAGNKGIQTNSTTTFTNQKIIQNYLLNKYVEITSIEYIRIPFVITYSASGGVTETYNNISYSWKLNSVNAAGTIATLKTGSSTFTNKAGTTGMSDSATVELSSITGINPGDLLYLEFTIQADITSGHSSVQAGMNIAHANDANSQIYLTYGPY